MWEEKGKVFHIRGKKKRACGQWEAVFNLKTFLPERLCYESRGNGSLLISFKFVVISQISGKISKLYKDKWRRDSILLHYSVHIEFRYPLVIESDFGFGGFIQSYQMMFYTLENH